MTRAIPTLSCYSDWVDFPTFVLFEHEFRPRHREQKPLNLVILGLTMRCSSNYAMPGVSTHF